MCLSPIECILPIGIYPSIFAAVADAVGAKNSNGFFTFLTIFTSLSRHSFMRDRKTHSSFSHHLTADFYVPFTLLHL